jgi:hypothetical protein
MPLEAQSRMPATSYQRCHAVVPKWNSVRDEVCSLL